MTLEIFAYVLLIITMIVLIVISVKSNSTLTAKDVTKVAGTIDDVVETINKYEFVFKMAKKFVILAKNDYESLSGKEKREWVIDKLQDICNNLNIVIPEVELEAINEDAYNEMKKELKE